MRWLSESDLNGIYGPPAPAALRKVADHVTPDYQRFIEVSRFCVLSTVGPEGTDASPRGDDGPVALLLDARHIALPDWRGNQRIDSLRNITRDPRASLMFFVRGSDMVVRVNSEARLTDDAGLRARFDRDGKQPQTVAVLAVGEVYFQCARAIMRAALWAGQDDSAGLATAGQILAGMTAGEVGGADYDRAWPARAAASMW